MRTREVLRRLERSNPYSHPAGHDRTAWSEELLALATAESPDPPPRARRRGPARRGLVVALACALLIGGGAALAAIAITREAPEATQRSVRAALDLPAPDRLALSPVPGSIREALTADTPYGTWVVYTIETRGRGTLITDGIPRPDGTLRGGAIGGCPPGTLERRPVIASCGAGTGLLGPGGGPAVRIVGRVSDAVRRVEVELPGGSSVSGWTERGFFLILLASQPDPGNLRLIALDGAGGKIGAETLRTTSDMPLPILISPERPNPPARSRGGAPASP